MDLVQSNLGCCSWIVLGAISGWLASILTGRNNRQGCLMNIIVGIVGAFIGGAAVALLTDGTFTIGWSLPSFVVSFLGAVALLAIVNFFSRRR
jgi:uncharacterized membrane protein YeaQ/YmgE (transglycosylase-associated protein family)